MNKMFVKKGDTVMIISGDDKGKKGKVLEVSPKEGKVIVEGRNIVKKHVKPVSYTHLSYRFTINKKVRSLAIKSAFSAKVADNEFIAVDSINFD